MTSLLKKLEIDKKVPSPSREEIIEVLLGAWKATSVDFNAVFNRLFVINAFDGSESALVLHKLFSLIRDDTLEYRRQLSNFDFPANLQTVAKKV